MRREAPDKYLFQEIKDFNLEFLGLLAVAGQRRREPAFGLDSAIAEAISRMTPAQLESMAAAPCLLARFASARRSRAPRVGEPRPPDDSGWLEHARLFAAGLLTYAWQMARRDALRAALCIGPGAHELIDACSVRDSRDLANRALLHLEARFCDHPRFWPDLIRATRDGRPERMQLARLTAIQAATLEGRRRYSSNERATGVGGAGSH